MQVFCVCVCVCVCVDKQRETGIDIVREIEKERKMYHYQTHFKDAHERCWKIYICVLFVICSS